MTKRKLEMIEAAGNLLIEQDLSGLTIKNLVSKIGFAESAVYRH